MATPDTLSAPIDLARVRSLFSRPQRMERSDFLRREIAARMHERLMLVKVAPRRVLDAGCGSGADLALLQKDYPAAHIVGLDAAAAMIEAAKTPASALKSLNQMLSRLLPGKAGVDLLCGDFGSLPFGANSVDLVWSNLALHWHPQPDRVFAEWRRVLRQDGLLMFSNFGPDTLRELRSAFAEADAAPHVLPFVDMHDFGDQLVAAGFSTPVMDMEVITVTYDTAAALLADARALGGNPLATRGRGLLGRAAWQRMLAALERQRRADGKLGLTFEVIYGHAFRPAPRVTAAGEAIIRFEPRKGR
ncbi:methyltransferase domain-containing protein [Massilia sp. P8910]|uniref:methyltransferase domain-containing protein n=1 Tax=Massilia antarctica TaxID=2765360 RepID=UPI0006BB8D66|nr:MULTISPECIES: methyltransferase domain-containing protein [Massilia]MCE3603441.1 methyltransferase domain-containing protein [Massilia antarctica]MCY0912919.1 methyltransferase domain-containing protein [Massilia sp. H27-R4]CUI07495.1 SAM-dependent methyltransferase, BioC-like [Janthinobacterium sp. CG23_2]CUU31281.1 SAM-dependent methyltransferase, BioC-like [Janthinobacterium sp. CG23_2]